MHPKPPKIITPDELFVAARWSDEDQSFSNLVVGEGSEDSPQLHIGYTSIDLELQPDVLVLTQAQWDALGQLPYEHKLVKITEHPLLSFLFSPELMQGTENAITHLEKTYPNGFTYLGVDEWDEDDKTPENIAAYLLYLHDTLTDV